MILLFISKSKKMHVVRHTCNNLYGYIGYYKEYNDTARWSGVGRSRYEKIFKTIKSSRDHEIVFKKR